jgi:hypothetical protein
VATSDDPRLPEPANQSEAWRELAPDYERARSREDSLDQLVEWPAQRAILGDVTGLSVLDIGCGNGTKLAELAIDVSANFLKNPPTRTHPANSSHNADQ